MVGCFPSTKRLKIYNLKIKIKIEIKTRHKTTARSIQKVLMGCRKEICLHISRVTNKKINSNREDGKVGEKVGEKEDKK